VCRVARPTPNGLLDSTSDILSHELFETITDPDPNSGWVAQSSLPVFGAEIGDLCQIPQFRYGAFSINGKMYKNQPEYSNKFHGCATTP
jgi:hypothetical protein